MRPTDHGFINRRREINLLFETTLQDILKPVLLRFREGYRGRHFNV